MDKKQFIISHRKWNTLKKHWFSTVYDTWLCVQKCLIVINTHVKCTVNTLAPGFSEFLRRFPETVSFPDFPEQPVNDTTVFLLTGQLTGLCNKHSSVINWNTDKCTGIFHSRDRLRETEQDVSQCVFCIPARGVKTENFNVLLKPFNIIELN